MSTDLLTREEVQHRRGNVWAYVSPSRLNCWIGCPLKFKLAYIDGIRLPTSPSLFLGKVVHASMEALYRHRQLGITLDMSDLSRRLVDSWGQLVAEEDMKFTSAAEEESLRSQAGELVAAYVRQLPPDEPQPLAVEAAVEAPLVAPLTGEDLGIPMLGIMDLVLDGQDGPVISDFKTAGRSSEPLETTHEIQLTSYAYLFRHADQRQEAGLEIRSLIKTKIPNVEFHRYPARTEAHLLRLFAVIRAYLDDLNAGRFIFRPGFGCAMCDFATTHCRSWAG